MLSLFSNTCMLSDVYDRLVQKGKKPGFVQLLATQTVSAVWHVSFKYINLQLFIYKSKFVFHIEPSSINFTFYKCIEFDCGQNLLLCRDYTQGT